MVTFNDVKQHPTAQEFIKKGNEHLGAMGFTEHSFRHTSLVAKIASNILERLKYSEREVELAAIAGYLHDIGNVVSRYNHGQSGAVIAYDILRSLEMDDGEIATIIAAIGNHEEQYGESVNSVAAALILADKSDVHRSRVRNPDVSTYDIHDRVNYGAIHSFLNVDTETRKITLELEIDQEITTVMEYFEIFLSRMVMCRRAAEFLDASFGLVINDAKLL
ncbi:HD domain-containing protein [Proteinivorax hydrogeniformans]|uniref:HD domain-containing protein n=1 Tax=Proteinivorax hydrogeniformans TaxID=1826727 RepID=A0AAU8HSC5_9FIRM